MKAKLIILVVLSWLALALTDETTQKAVPIAEDSAANTTVQPRVNITDSAICKKCTCNAHYKVLDCSHQNMSEWFSDDEWKLLANGDVVFTTIKLDHNNLTNVPVLPSYAVEKLHLAFNKIAKIEDGAFQNLNLSVIDLSHNQLTAKELHPDIFKGSYSPKDYQPLQRVVELDLGYNDLHTLDADLFEHLPNLQTLILCENTFTKIDVNALSAISGITTLKTLDLSYMELTDLPDTLLHGPRELETLILTGNLFKKLPAELQFAKNLRRLVLDENLFASIADDNKIPALNNLRELYMSYMPDLEIIGEGAFSELQNLTLLVASNNPKLRSIHENAFAKTADYLEYYDYPPLTELHLRNNNLTTIEKRLLQRWDKLTFIDLALNPWACNLSNSWLIKVLMSQINNTDQKLTRNVTCASPPAWRDTSLMDLNLRSAVLVSEENHPEGDSVVLVSLLVCVLIGIPLIIASVVLYRRGCFGIIHRGSSSNGILYNRANFNEDMHI